MKRGRECSHIVIQQKENYAVLSPHASVCARKREDGFTEYKGRGATLFLPSSYFLYHSSICHGGVEGWVWGVKRGRKGNNILTLQHMLLLPHTQIWVLMDSYKFVFFSPQIHCLSDSECKVSLSGSPFSLGLTVTSTPSLLSA